MRKILLPLIFSLTALLGLHAQSENDAIYIYRNDGQFNAFFDARVDSITCSHYDADSIWHSDWQMQVVYTSDSIYRIPLAVIDSVTFHPLEPVLNEKVFPLTPEHAPYILSADTLSFTMSSTTPNPLRPSLGNIVVASYDCMAFPDGIMALVVSVEETSSGILYLCESASMDDVYEQILYHGICENPGAATRFTGRADGILWDEDFQMQIAAGGTTTDFSVNDVAAFEITLQKTLGSPLYTRIVVANNIRMQVDFNASSEASISEQRQLGPTVNCGRIGVPQFPLIWFAPQLMLYGYFEEDGAVSLDFSAHMNRRDKITLTYNGGQWTSRHDPFVESAVDVASLSMDGSAEIGLKPEIRLSLNGSPTSIGISLRSGVKQYCSFKFDALSYLDTGVYDALKESRFRTALTRGGSIFAQAGIIESSSMRHEHPLLDSEQPLGEECWLLPLFTVPEYSEGASKNMAILSSTVSRELLFPVEVGLSLYDDKDNLVSTKYHPVSYGSSDTWNFTQLEQSFESLSPGKRYVCYPMVKLFGAEYRATPFRDFRLDALVETGEASSVTANSAVVAGYAEGLESAETLCELGVCYTTSGTPSINNGKFVSSGRTSSGEFTVSLTGLKPNTTYYYVTLLAIDGEYFYGDVKSFETKGAVVETGEASSVTVSSAVVAGYAEGLESAETLCELGVCYSTSGTPSINNGKFVSSGRTSSGEFTVSLTGLKPNTTYYYVTLLAIDGEYFYGDVKSFETKGAAVETGEASSVTASSAVVSGYAEGLESAETLCELGVCYSTSGTPSIKNGKFVSSGRTSSGDFTVSLTGLKPNTTYYYVTLLAIDGEYFYGDVKSFETKGAVVETGEASSVTANSAVLAGHAEGLESAETLCELGICYSTSGTPSMDNGKFVSSGRKSSGDFTVSVSDLKPNTTYYYATCLAIDGEYFYGETKSFKTKGADLCNDANHVHPVDLGLSVKWACCNVGAESPEDYGGYYAWGETEEKSKYYYNTYKYWSDKDGDGKSDSNEYQNIGSNISGTSYDVAHVKWGGSWRMPTLDEIKELCNKCSWEWTSVNGVSGRKVTGPNGNSIFLPAAGIRNGTEVYHRGSTGSYWSGTLYEGYSYFAYSFSLYSPNYSHSRYHGWGYDYRFYGHTVRPVTE